MKKNYYFHKRILFAAGLFVFNFSVAQREYNIWCFGSYAGVNFNSGSPVSFSGAALSTTEGSSSIADTAGNLLFYSDGITVWNRNHVAMPNGTGLYGGGSSTQSALIVKQPGNATLYYVFTTAEALGPNGFCYSIVDMSLSGGLGDVTIKNIQLFTPSAEKVCAHKHSNGTDLWVVGHEMGTNNFRSYLLTSAGLSASPVVTAIGTVHTSSSTDVIGYMKISPDGTHLALAVRYQYIDELFDFDASTGVVSNPVTITVPSQPYGVEFSPDNTKLYLSGNFGVYQYDLTSGNAAAIIASQTLICTDTWALQLATDNKIYSANYGGNSLNVINSPNLAGAACNYTTNAVILSPGICNLGLPNSVPASFSVQLPHALFNSSDTTFCNETGECIDFFDHSTGNVTSWQWLFPGAVPDTSTLQNPTSICYFNPGTYAVTLIATNANGTDTFAVSPMITMATLPSPPSITVTGADTLTSTPATSYQWYLNGAPIAGATDSMYVAATTGTYAVRISDGLGCSVFSNGVYITITSTSEFERKENEIGIFPNPVSDKLSVSGIGVGSCDVLEIYNVLGEKIYIDQIQISKSLNKITIDLTSLSSGVYFLKIEYGRISRMIRFVKQ